MNINAEGCITNVIADAMKQTGNPSFYENYKKMHRENAFFDLNNDGSKEILVSLECMANNCPSVLYEKKKNCYRFLGMFQGAGLNIGEIDNSTSISIGGTTTQVNGYKYLESINISGCAGADHEKTIFAYNGKKYVPIITATFTLCDFSKP
jgi:hypothetical protein